MAFGIKVGLNLMVCGQCISLEQKINPQWAIFSKNHQFFLNIYFGQKSAQIVFFFGCKWSKMVWNVKIT